MKKLTAYEIHSLTPIIAKLQPTCQQCIYTKEKSMMSVVEVCQNEDQISAYYDNEGHWHVHNETPYSMTLKCSRGHESMLTFYLPCPWCSWRKALPTFVEKLNMPANHIEVSVVVNSDEEVVQARRIVGDLIGKLNDNKKVQTTVMLQELMSVDKLLEKEQKKGEANHANH